MAVVNIRMDTRNSVAKALLPQDVELNILAIELFYYACTSWHLSGFQRAADDIGVSVEIDQITLSNPFDIWAFFKSIPVGLAAEVLDRTLYYRVEIERRSAEAAKVRQSLISDKLDNLRKANELRNELLSSGTDPDEVTRLLAQILSDQGATLEVLDVSQRKSPLR
ncbi:hypothetical protein E0H51_31635 [Rhizobium leguminosarum bv. viciae]|uniref:hypothetical protein n=1 Tax=Rhizobium leguminosarum TaxID=384 RepID=UPI00103D12A6|nr:hypothetical protein [Rhizobium leguminosarum]TBY68962.1 hypothetical protein E0H51_31635 [Rhizobium leguminosarum bv. viciae]